MLTVAHVEIGIFFSLLFFYMKVDSMAEKHFNTTRHE